MKSYKKNRIIGTTLQRNETMEGETIEQKINRIVNNKEPIKDGAPMIYTERTEGVKAAYNVRTDRFEIAIDGMDKVQKSSMAKREERHKSPETEPKVIDLETGGESTQGTK